MPRKNLPEVPNDILAKVRNLRQGSWVVASDLQLPYDKHVGGAHLDKHLVREYRERWRAVEAVDAAEQRCSSVGWRLQQMDAIYKLAAGLQLAEKDWSEEEAAGYERWALVKRRMR